MNISNILSGTPTISPFVPGGPSAPTGPGGPCQRNVTYNVIGSIQRITKHHVMDKILTGTPGLPDAPVSPMLPFSPCKYTCRGLVVDKNLFDKYVYILLSFQFYASEATTVLKRLLIYKENVSKN